MAAAISADGSTVVAGGADGVLRAWQNGVLQPVVRELRGGVRALAFSGDGRTVIIADHKRRLTRLTVGTWARARPMVRLGRGGPAYSAAISGDGHTIVVVNAGEGRRIVPRDTRTGKVPIQLDALPNIIDIGIDFTGEWIVAASSSGRMQIIQVGSEAVVREVDHGKPLTRLALHPTAKLFASGATDGSVALWDLAGAAKKPFAGTLGGGAVITALAFSPTGKELSAAGTNFQLHTFDVEKGSVRDVLLGTPNGGAPLLAFSADGARLALAGPDGLIHLWDLRTGQQSDRISGLPGVSAMVFEAAGRLAVASQDGHISLYDGTKQVWQRDARDAFAMLTTNGKQIVAASAVLGQAKRFDLATGKELLPPIGRPKDNLRAVSFSPDGTRVAVGNRVGAIAVYDVSGDIPKKVTGLLKGKGRVLAFGWRADGKTVAASFERGGMLLYEVPKTADRPPALQRSGMTPLHAIAVAGTHATAGAADGSVRRWNLSDLTPNPRRGGASASPRWAVSANGNLAAVSDADGRVRVMQFHPEAKVALNIFAVGDAWVAWTNGAFYTGNVEGAGFLRVQVGQETKQVADFPALKNDGAVKRALAGL